ncbi:MAG: DUF63 family protein, partial [Candidatus Aenigmarchaeota archaeon]|nr:DUF63 family protein [Candidatus Aenigmarchaeota archaeon]
DKFVNPLCNYYTLEATIAYGLILVVAVLGIYKLLQKLNVKIDKNFFIALIPFIIFGGWTRALRDHALYEGWWWCSPPIYFMIFAITFLTLLGAIYLDRKFKIPYHKTAFVVGIVLLLYNLTLTQITNLFAVQMILGITAGWGILFYIIHRMKPKLLSLENTAIMLAHLLDASATYTALTYFGYYEQHVLPRFLITMFGPLVMFPLKIIVVGVVLYFLDKEEDKFLRNFLKIIVLILGLALGIRDLLTVSML